MHCLPYLRPLLYPFRSHFRSQTRRQEPEPASAVDIASASVGSSSPPSLEEGNRKRSRNTSRAKPGTSKKTRTESSATTGNNLQQPHQSSSSSSSSYTASSKSESSSRKAATRTHANKSNKKVKASNNSSPSNNSRFTPNSETGSGESSRRRSTRLTGKVPSSTSDPTSDSTNNLASSATASSSTGGSSSTRDQKSQPVSGMDDNNGRDTNTASASATSSTVQANVAVSSSGGSSGGGEDTDDSEMGRLQALLEARGLPPHIFGALGHRVQHLLHRSIGTTASTKGQQLLLGLQATGDEGQQLQSVMEMCQLLVMGNEDSLAGFPVKQAVPALMSLLHMEHNFDIMNHAVRALTYMMESLPRSSNIVVEAVPVFLEKLQVIQCMDVAEQSLTALEMLSKRHSKNILQAQGVSACLTYIDFFSINAQRAALTIAANCCQNLTPEEFHLIKPSIGILSNHLSVQDKKCIENTCIAFSRLVESYHANADILLQIASENLLSNLQQLLMVSPQVISTSTFVMVVRMMATMCSSCPQLAVDLLKLNVAGTLKYLLLGVNSTDECLELSGRSPQEFYELTSLIAELMPELPIDGIFRVDCLLSRSSQWQTEASWQWKDERGNWHPFDPHSNKILESAQSAGEEDVQLTYLGQTFIVDFSTMTQVNDETGVSRVIQRRAVTVSSSSCKRFSSSNPDPRTVCIRNEPEVVNSFVKSLFGVLYEVYSSSAGPTVRHKCLQALLRIIYYSPSDLLQFVLKNQAVSRHIAAMLASPDLRIVVGAIQMANILMEKLPDVFCVYFRREGVMHQFRNLVIENPTSDMQTNESSTMLNSSTTSSTLDTSTPASWPSSPSTESMSSTQAVLSPDDRSGRRKRSNTKKNPCCATAAGRRRGDSDARSRLAKSSISSTSSPAASRLQSPCADTESLNAIPSTSSSHAQANASCNSTVSSSASRSRRLNFLSNFHPSRWGRWTSPGTSSSTQMSSRSAPNEGDTHSTRSVAPSAVASSGQRDKIKTWIREQARDFEKRYFPSDSENVDGNRISDSHPAMSTLNRLSKAVDSFVEKEPVSAFDELKSVLMEGDISPFELIHSGIVTQLYRYLTEYDSKKADDRKERIRIFLSIFLGCPKTASLDPKTFQTNSLDPAPYSALVSKLHGCISQLEQFPVRVHDIVGTGTGGSVRGTSALKFFNTHQLKCNLQRHPGCTNLKQWHGGPVRIDPLALVQAIEKYLVTRGYGRIRENEDENSDEDNSEEEFNDLTLTPSSGQGQRHKLQFYINDHLLPYNMTVYQAIRQFSVESADSHEMELDVESSVGQQNMWEQTHVIFYRPYVEGSELPNSLSSHANSSFGIRSSSLNRKAKTSSSKSTSGKKKDELWTDGKVPEPVSPIDSFLDPEVSFGLNDPSTESILLLRALHGISTFWGYFYDLNKNYKCAIPQSDFISAKLTAKANRQLQDPLVIMTGNLPAWLSSIAYACPFLFPFETRHLLFYVTCFDRDRALQRLLDSTPGLNSNDSTERVTPRLDRRKKTVSRDDLLRQAEMVLQDVSSSKSLLEIQYENEVGTGLGPTLEFYALVSLELQKAELDLWKGEVSKFVLLLHIQTHFSPPRQPVYNLTTINHRWWSPATFILLD